MPEDAPTVEEMVADSIRRLKALASSRDTEAAHGEADDILCELLDHLGYGEVVEAWHEIDKWYA